MNKNDLKQALDERGISYPEDATNGDLKQLLSEAPTEETSDLSEAAADAADAADSAAKAAAEATGEEAANDEALIAEKVAAGLHRNQAIEVIAAQRAFDEAQKKAQEETKG